MIKIESKEHSQTRESITQKDARDFFNRAAHEYDFNEDFEYIDHNPKSITREHHVWQMMKLYARHVLARAKSNDEI